MRGMVLELPDYVRPTIWRAVMGDTASELRYSWACATPETIGLLYEFCPRLIPLGMANVSKRSRSPGDLSSSIEAWLLVASAQRGGTTQHLPFAEALYLYFALLHRHRAYPKAMRQPDVDVCKAPVDRILEAPSGTPQPDVESRSHLCCVGPEWLGHKPISVAAPPITRIMLTDVDT
ncbi:hypothetical protein CONLIGDRAFT_646231 [Coniochaeta ligniaria NRRL 30616]|uniref:Uncharacterized protein n=1 Tax=Coniochaeta ligniaria NRRL 30616 TaxID=1408157 RepID=A0A1J7JK40_9PEZI|nr:hypothetical protein CONLIGDRAFT_646231 [Coniochaeta ligniaria NRRL 30616]